MLYNGNGLYPILSKTHVFPNTWWTSCFHSMQYYSVTISYRIAWKGRRKASGKLTKKTSKKRDGKYNISTVMDTVFQTNFKFHVKQHTTRKAEFLSLGNVLLLLTKFSFWKEDWAIGYNSIKFRDFLNIFWVLSRTAIREVTCMYH